MSPRTILITRANGGIGFSVLQVLVTRSPSDHYLLATHNTENGVLAIQDLRKLALQAEIDIVELGVANESSIKESEREIRKQYGRLDILVNKPGGSPSKKATLGSSHQHYLFFTTHDERLSIFSNQQ